MSVNRNYSSVFSEIKANSERKGFNSEGDIVFLHEDWNITQLLSMLPKKNVSEHFDRRMAAAFSLELEREVTQKNTERIREKN